jgi:hypothetical protein
MTPNYIPASHLDVETDAYLRESATKAILDREAARDAQRAAARQAETPQQAVTPSRPRPKVTVTKKAAAKKQQPHPQSSAQAAPPVPAPPQVPALPPGARIMTAEEMTAIDHLLQTHPETRHLFGSRRERF